MLKVLYGIPKEGARVGEGLMGYSLLPSCCHGGAIKHIGMLDVDHLMLLFCRHC